MMRTAAEKESARRPMCPVCRKYFYDITTLRRHMEIHDSQRQKYVLNSGLHPSLWKQKFIIKRRSSPATNLVMEGLDLSSSRSSRPTCPICSKCFYNSVFNEDDEISSYTCAQDGKRILFGTDFMKPYCSICNRQFSRIKSLRRHHQVVHALYPKVFACNWCPRSYNRKDNLKQHVNMCHVDVVKENS
ncbi:hypothetical protein TNCT_577981 [Trichonephila clavata]|uniref:C2H2-type domain-containing protein n=1 Tax=Trichonephila clavata TaxID=2740835 RepID=A0A8X6J4T4_TRICU|nr:hypothetical protein TNCT_577981 [Trichonephila clavata]